MFSPVWGWHSTDLAHWSPSCQKREPETARSSCWLGSAGSPHDATFERGAGVPLMPSHSQQHRCATGAPGDQRAQRAEGL